MTDPGRTIIHMDMDAFFASVEVADDPSLAGKPVIIGRSARGVVSAASYEARVYGVHSAMPVMQARKLCPQGVFLPGRGHRYGEISRQVMAIVREYSPLVQQTSVDEAYLDATGTSHLYGEPADLAMLIKMRVLEETGLTCSCGVAPNKYLAKVCSDLDKPDGLYVLEPGRVTEFLAGLPLKEVPGIGPKTREHLRRYHVRFAGDLARFPLSFWQERFGEKGGEFLHRRGLGLDDSPVRPHREPKSSGAENTFAQDTKDREELLKWLLVQSERVGRDIRRNGYFARTVTLKVKYADFTSITKRLSLKKATNTTERIFEAASELLEKVRLDRKVRLVGVSVSSFSRGEGQLNLFDAPGPERDERLDQALDAISDKFGSGAVTRGRVFGFSKRGH